MTIVIPQYSVYVLSILCMCVFYGCYFYRSKNKEQLHEKVELALQLFMTIVLIIIGILYTMWLFSNANGAK